MESTDTTSCREYFIGSGMFFLLTVFTGGLYLWAAVEGCCRSRDRRTAETRLDNVELAVRDRDNARIELPRDRQLGNLATSLVSEVATQIT
jgi:hypothetical protein